MNLSYIIHPSKLSTHLKYAIVKIKPKLCAWLNLYEENTSQASYTGKNLIPNNLTNQTINGITFAVNSDGSVTINGTASATTQINLLTDTIGEADEITLPAGTYTLQGCPAGGSSSGYKFDITNDGSAIITDYGNNVYSRTFTDSWVFDRVRIVVQSGTTVNNLTFKPMLVEGNTNVPYEPYTGGQPSPSPDYPQDIRTVTGNNTVTILNTNYPLNLGNIELCKIGDYQDVIFNNIKCNPLYDENLEENGWYKYGAIKEWKSEDYINNVWQKTQTTDEYSYFYTNSKDTLIKSGIYNGYCNLLNVKKSSLVVGTEVKTDTINYGDSGYAKIRIKIKTNRLSEDSIQGLKNWFSSVDVTSLIILAVPTTTQITDETLISQLEAIKEKANACGVSSITLELDGETIVNV